MIAVKHEDWILKGYFTIQLKNGKKISINEKKFKIGNKSLYCHINIQDVKKIREQSRQWEKENSEYKKQQSREYEKNHREQRNQQARLRLVELKKHPRKYAEWCKKQRERNQQRLKKKELQKNV